MMISPTLEMKVNTYGALHYFSSPAFNPVQLLSYMFVHASFSHLFFNMFALLMFGSTIERALGSGRFLFYYISCGIGAALVQMGVFAIMVNHYADIINNTEYVNYAINQGYEAIYHGQPFYGTEVMADLARLVNTPTVGASGAVFGVLLAFGMLFPNQPLYLFFIPYPIKAKWVVLGYGVLELFFGFTGIASNVAHFAHLGGMLIGFIMILYWKRRGDFNNRWFF